MVEAADPAKREKSDTLRYLMCEPFIDLYRKASTRSKCSAGFGSSGIALNPSVQLSSQFVIDFETPHPGVQHMGTLSCTLLTGEGGLARVGMLEHG
jgi:hypothetical protein